MNRKSAPDPASAREVHQRTARFLPIDADRGYLRSFGWLAVALLLQLLAVGGRWDLPVAAWLVLVVLLRFSRVSRPIGLVGVWLVLVAGGFFWALQLAVPISGLTAAGIGGLSIVALLPFAVDRFVVHRRGGEWTRLLVFPTALVAAQYALGTFNPFGTAYGLLAVTQRDNTALLQILAITGPYAFAGLFGLVASSVDLVRERGWARPVLRRAVVGPALVCAVLVGGQSAMAFFPATDSPSVRVGGVLPDNAISAATDRALGVSATDYPAVARLAPERVDDATASLNTRLLADTRAAARGGAKVVMWSENAAKVRAVNEAAFLAQAGAVAREEGIYLSLAANVYTSEPPFARDQAVLIGPDGQVRWTYRKQHPIPGLENYVAGTAPAPVITTPYGRLSTIICYDADFPADARIDTDILLVPGGDWPEIGRTHTEMSGLRAIENGYSLVRTDFNGFSAAFNGRGEVLSRRDTTSPTYTPWYADIPTRGHSTLYPLTGDVLSWIALLGTVAWLAVAVVRPRRYDDGSPAD